MRGSSMDKVTVISVDDLKALVDYFDLINSDIAKEYEDDALFLTVDRLREACK
jgi:hypothetical protein